MQNCPGDEAVESRRHPLAGHELCKEGQNMLDGDTRAVTDGGMKSFGKFGGNQTNKMAKQGDG